LGKHQEAKTDSSTNDEQLSQKHKYAPNRMGNSVSTCVLYYQQKPIPGSRTEGFRSKSYLDISIFSDVFDASVKTGETIAGATQQAFHNLIVFIGCLNLPSVIIEYQLNHLYDSDDERAKSN
jgi:hypothetical protein